MEYKKGMEYSELILINKGLKYSVAVPKIRSCLFNDETNRSIIEKLTGIEGAENYEDFKHDQIVFILPLTALKKQE